MIKYIQVNSSELGKVDLRQAKLVKKHEPDIVVFEIPHTHKLTFNKFRPSNKPKKEYAKMIKKLRSNERKYPQSLADIAIWENIHELWTRGKNVKVFNIDAPDEIRKHKFFKEEKYSFETTRRKWHFWVYLFIREMNMTKHLRTIIEKIKRDQKVTIAMFLELEHWKHVQFLLTSPTKKQIWDYYFKRFPELTPKNIDTKIKNLDKMYYKYWKKVSLWK